MPYLPTLADQPSLSPQALSVTLHLLMHGPASRGQLGKTLALSDASMSRVARALVQDGIVQESLDPTTGMGRPRQILSALPSARHVVGVKLTADTAFGVACDMLGSVNATAEAALPAAVDGQVPVEAATKVVTRLVRGLSRRQPTLDGVGVAVGGTVRDRAIVHEGTFLGWHDVDVAGPLSQEIGAPVVVSNDVTALAREQLWFGAGRTHATFGVITVGAGLGFGVVREGHVVEQLIDDGHLLAHSPLDARGPACELGHRGCLSAFLGRDELHRRVCPDGDRADFDQLWRDPAQHGTRWFRDAARALGHLVATFAGALQTERIVLAGEDVDPLVASPTMAQVLADRLRDRPGHARVSLDISTDPLSFTDWARGAAVVSIQHVLGAL